MTLRDKLFGFRGRVRRQDWWLLGILVGIAQLVTMFAAASVHGALNPGAAIAEAPFYDLLNRVPVWISLPIQLVFVWPTLSLSVQRYHDRNHSAWPIFAYYAVLYGADYLPEQAWGWLSALDNTQQGIVLFVWGAIWIVAAIGILIVLGFLDGTQGPNRYGPSPKGIGGSPATVFD